MELTEYNSSRPPKKMKLEEIVARRADSYYSSGRRSRKLFKLYLLEDKVSKREMFNYYHQVGPFTPLYLLYRPMSLNRFSGRIHRESFYQKNVKETAPDWARTAPHIDEKYEEKSYLLIYNKATLWWVAILGCIEMNPCFPRQPL